MATSLDVLIVAGEVSGDEHGAKLVAAVQANCREIQFFGMGGSKLRALGVDTVVDCERDASLMGLSELRGSLSKVLNSYNRLISEVEKRRPSVAVLIDYAEFNLRLAKALHRRGVKVLYFIPPQMWAWRKGRVRDLRRYVTSVASIFPFEEAFYAKHGVRAQFVGHPFCYRPEPHSREKVLTQLGLDPSRPVLALLPGSRHSEVARLLLPMLDAVEILRRGRPGLQCVIPVAASLDTKELEEIVAGATDISLVKGGAWEILSAADVAVVASGTATVEAALAGVPFVAVYKLARFTYFCARLLVRGVNSFAMANLIAGRRIVPELLQDQVTGPNIAQELERYLGDPLLSNRVRGQLKGLRDRLSGPDDGSTPGQRVATMLLELCGVKREDKSDDGSLERAGWRKRVQS